MLGIFNINYISINVKEKLTFERETSVEDDKTRFGVGAGFRVGGIACVASNTMCYTETQNAPAHDRVPKCDSLMIDSKALFFSS